MEYYLAPMEGITGYVFRRALRDHFTAPDKYVTPFIAPNQNRCMNARERSDVLPEHNVGARTVPQILTNQADIFQKTCRELQEMGYEEVNLNLGCPSGTVAAKGRGAGFLADLEGLDRFLDQVFANSQVRISIKTRLGIQDPEEFFPILEIYEKYPLEELIIHPRVQKDFYKNKPRLEIFGEAAARSRHRICYNGDLFTIPEIQQFRAEFPGIPCIMLGRGMVANPGLLQMLSDDPKETAGQPTGTVTKEKLLAFHDQLLAEYGEFLSGDRNLLFKMKELWFYMIRLFGDSKKEEKKLKKVQRLSEYREIVQKLFAEKELVFEEHLYF